MTNVGTYTATIIPTSKLTQNRTEPTRHEVSHFVNDACIVVMSVESFVNSVVTENVLSGAELLNVCWVSLVLIVEESVAVLLVFPLSVGVLVVGEEILEIIVNSGVDVCS